MRPASYRPILALAFVCFAAVGIALARSAADPEADAFTAETPEMEEAAAMPMIRPGSLPLSDEERAQIFDSVMRTADIPVADVEPPQETLPASVAMHDLPMGVAQEIPLAEGYKFVKLDDRILLVHPDTRRVVAEMPRYKLALQ